MSNFAALMKDEFRRVARREARASIRGIRRIVSQHRRDVAALKRLVPKLAKAVAFLETQERGRVAEPQVSEKVIEKARFSSKWLKSHRKKLGLSANDYAKLVGVTALTIYNWESGKGKPTKNRLAALVAIRKIGRREALKRLELIGPSKKPGTAKKKKKKKKKKATRKKTVRKKAKRGKAKARRKK